MASDNRTIGTNLYLTGDAETRAWFEKQWRIWPQRADDRLTTNIALHYGGVVAYRQLHGREPELSRDFQSHVTWHDRQAARTQA